MTKSYDIFELQYNEDDGAEIGTLDYIVKLITDWNSRNLTNCEIEELNDKFMFEFFEKYFSENKKSFRIHSNINNNFYILRKL